ncbi:MAG: DUF721 domain-containing protein [Desulfovibrio sp.]|nr:DUF721 domain-containing protein [Desulfovibrio sp.]
MTKPKAPRRRFRKMNGDHDVGPVSAADVLVDVLRALGGGPERDRLLQLWHNWNMVLGPELAPFALPLGSRRNTLLVGAEDAMLAQELQLQSGEILERVNAFMESPYFRKVRVSLQLGQDALHPAGENGPDAHNFFQLEK